MLLLIIKTDHEHIESAHQFNENLEDVPIPVTQIKSIFRALRLFWNIICSWLVVMSLTMHIFLRWITYFLYKEASSHKNDKRLVNVFLR